MSGESLFTNDVNYYLFSTVLYALSAALYGINFFYKKKLNLAGRIAALAGLTVQSAGMIIRWIATGQPTFVSLYEMMLWFAWGAVVVMLIAELRFKYKELGFFVLPFTVIIMGIVLLMPGGGSGGTMPALQSTWLYIHVAVAIVSYAAFLVGFSAAIMYFIKKNIKPSWFAFCASLFSLSVLSLINGGELLKEQALNIYLPAREGVAIVDSFRDVGIILFLSAALFLISTFLNLWNLIKREGKKSSGKHQKQAAIAFIGAASTLSLGLILFIIRLAVHPVLKIASQPLILAFLLSLFIIDLLSVLIILKYDVFQERLPSEGLLDNLQYYAVTFGFPFLTLTIITGAFWANRAWGSYWGNDPKEWAAAVTWLVYAAYLHMRITRGWGGIKAAVILAIGFAAVIFTLLGVTYLAPRGLHSYI